MAKILRDLRVDFASLVDAPANKFARVELFKRDFSQEQRDRMAEEGQAMPGGGYPIANRTDLQNAIRAIGRAKNPEATKAHIKRRAKALGLTDLLPEDWMAKSGGANCADDDLTEDEKAKMKGPNMKKQDETPTVETLTAQVAELTKQIEARDAKLAELEKAAAPKPTVEDVLKAQSDEVRKYVEQIQREAAEGREIAKAERDLRLNREYIEKARGYDALPIDPTTFGPVLKRLQDGGATAADYAELDRVLKAADEIARQSDLFKEKGRSAAGSDMSPWAQIEKHAEEIRKSDPSLTKEKAQVLAMERNPALARAAHAESH